MALITAAELKASREAIEAKVETVSDTAANDAIADAELVLYSILGYRIEDTATSLTLRVRGSGVTALFPVRRVRAITSVTQDGSTVTAADYKLESDGFILRRPATYWTNETDVVINGTFGYVSTDDKWKLAKRVVKLLAVHYLESTKVNAVPGSPGVRELESYSPEGATFTFRRPESDEGTLTEIGRAHV